MNGEGKKRDNRQTDRISECMTAVFVEQPLALPRFAKYLSVSQTFYLIETKAFTYILLLLLALET